MEIGHASPADACSISQTATRWLFFRLVKTNASAIQRGDQEECGNACQRYRVRACCRPEPSATTSAHRLWQSAQRPSATQIPKRISRRRIGRCARRSRSRAAGNISATCRGGVYGTGSRAGHLCTNRLRDTTLGRSGPSRSLACRLSRGGACEPWCNVVFETDQREPIGD
jgi:hypothetical protein